MSKKPRPPRPTPPTERPLDDGARDGTELWRTFDGVAFCHWDRWLLRLALTEPRGLDSIAGEFRGRATRHRWKGRSAEAMLAQIADLEARLGRLGLTPATALDDEERASEWLRKKAFKRVWHDGPHRSTEAMLRTPRAVLGQRALRGNWSVFPSSPAPHADAFSAVVGKGLYDYRGTGLVVTLLELKAEERQYAAGGLFESLTQLRTENGDFERLALHRAALTVAIEAMEQVDDSGGEMAEFFREHERALTLSSFGSTLRRRGSCATCSSSRRGKTTASSKGSRAFFQRCPSPMPTKPCASSLASSPSSDAKA